MQFFWRFLTLKGYSAISVFLGKSGLYDFESKHYICQFTSLDFHIIRGRFLYIPGGKFTLRLHPRILLKIWYFPRWVKQSPTGVLRKSVFKTSLCFLPSKNLVEILRRLPGMLFCFNLKARASSQTLLNVLEILRKTLQFSRA